MLRVLLPTGELTLSTRVAFLAEHFNGDGTSTVETTVPSDPNVNSVYFFLKQPQTSHYGVLLRRLTFSNVLDIANNLLVNGYCDLTKYEKDSNLNNVICMTENDYFEYLG